MKNLVPVPYQPSRHLPNLSKLLTVVEDHDQNGDDPSEAYLKNMLTWPDFDPENDCWVIPHPINPNDLIGYGSTYNQIPSRCYGFVAIHPGFRRHGLGSRLLSRIILRTRQRDSSQLAIDANSDNAAANAFLTYHNFQPVGHAWIMNRSAGQSASIPIWPDGFSILRYPEFKDPQLLADALNAFQDMWGHGQNERPTTAETATNNFLNYYNPEGVFVTFAPDGSAAGYVAILFNKKEDENGAMIDVLDAPGVVPYYRHLLLQRPLVQSALQYQQNHSQNPVELQSWGDTLETAALYNNLGFTTTAHFIAYLRNL